MNESITAAFREQLSRQTRRAYLPLEAEHQDQFARHDGECHVKVSNGKNG
jgi:hypothetical protein